MGKISIALTISMTVLIGCGTTHNVRREAAPQWAPKAFDRLAETRVRVELQSGRVCEGELVRLDEEEIQLSNQRTGQEMIRYSDRDRGACRLLHPFRCGRCRYRNGMFIRSYVEE
jgi:hypothetical protein